jgi:hypothetical protein
MISAEQCRICSSDCAARGRGIGISAKRAEILSVMARTWETLAKLTEEYDAVLKLEERTSSKTT